MDLAPAKLNKARVLGDKSEEDSQIHGHANQDDDAEEEGDDADEEEEEEEYDEEEEEEATEQDKVEDDDDDEDRPLETALTMESLASVGIESADGLGPEDHEKRPVGEAGGTPHIAPGPDFGAYTGESGFFDEFTVIICRGENDKVGLEVATFDQNISHLQVTKVKPGLVNTWNMANPDKAVKEGDLLVEVNGVTDSATGMLNRIVLDKISEILVRRHT